MPTHLGRAEMRWAWLRCTGGQDGRITKGRDRYESRKKEANLLWISVGENHVTERDALD